MEMPKKKNQFHFTLVNSLSELENLSAHVEAAAEQWQLPKRTALQLNLILDELFTNAVHHGFTDEMEHEIVIQLENLGKELLVTMVDDGCFFDSAGLDDPALDVPLKERQQGGLGVFLARHFAKSIQYNRKGGKNIVTLTQEID